MNGIGQRLEEIHSNHNHATFALTVYVHEMADQLKEHQAAANKVMSFVQQLGKKLNRESIPWIMGYAPDELREELHKIQIGSQEIEQGLQNLNSTANNIQAVTNAYPTMLIDMAYIYLVALYDAFFTDTLLAIHVAEPRTLNSTQKTLTYEIILKHTTKDDLIHFMARKAVEEIGYTSIGDQAKYLRQRFGIDLETSGVPAKRLTALIALRNILVHNRGIVNDIYLKEVPDTPFPLGTKVTISLDEWDAAVNDFTASATYIRDEATKKFQ